MIIGSIVFAIALATGAEAVSGADVPPLATPQVRLLQGVKFDQRLDNQVPLDLRFTDEEGRPVTIQECMAGRPTVLILAYYRCPMLCNQVLNGAVRTLRGVNFEPGKDISVVVVSFDPSDTVEMAKAKKMAIVDAYQPESDGAGWHFLTGTEESVRAIAGSVGFQYVYDEKSMQYAHASGIVLLTPDGRVSRYFYGIDYPTRGVRLGLVEASEGKIGSRVDQLLLLCFHYDPLTGQYGLAIMRTIRGTAIAFVVCLLSYIGLSLRREIRNDEGPMEKPPDDSAIS